MEAPKSVGTPGMEYDLITDNLIIIIIIIIMTIKTTNRLKKKRLKFNSGPLRSIGKILE
jgi:hypothetical protein